ncbi:MAG: NAD(P)/FAD-dependent oxidoreductase [Planctomycetota bacterium]
MIRDGDQYDVAVIGGGPGGSTTAAYLKKYSPQLRVALIEREEFPREHVGESQLPPIGRVLHEIGAWDKVEAAGFPIKLGASYTWGKTTEPWTFGFIPEAEIGDRTRPAKFAGWRRRVALQVDRAKYDQILLDHARELGADVLQPCKALRVRTDGAGATRRVTGLELETGRVLTARYYVDASGNSAIIRRDLGVKVDAPSLLRNVAFWNYWEADGLNSAMLEGGAMRVLIRSVSFGWIWYIVLSDRRTSVGLVCNAEFYKQSGKKPEELYRQAIAQEPELSRLLSHAVCTNKLSSANDWSYVAEESCGENWFLVGESLGFADPILAAGLTLTHTSAEHCAATILELDRDEQSPVWLRSQYHETQTQRVRQHIKFAEYWYSANGLFTDVLDNCREIASAAGLSFDPQEAFRWLSNGGIDDVSGQAAIGGLSLAGIKMVQQHFSHTDPAGVTFAIDGMNSFKLDLSGAKSEMVASVKGGRIVPVSILRRGLQRLPLNGIYGLVYSSLQSSGELEPFLLALKQRIQAAFKDDQSRKAAFKESLLCLEGMVAQGWVHCSYLPGKAALSMRSK